MTTKSLLAISILALLNPWAPSASSADSSGKDSKSPVLAKINERVISLDEFNQRYKENAKFFQFNAPDKKAVLEDLIKREVAIQEAVKQGLDKDPQVQERIHTVLFQALLDQKLTQELEKISVSNEEAQSFYSKNPEIRTSHIFVALRPDATAEQEAAGRKRLADIQGLLKQGASFAELAQTRSEGPAAPMGGDIDFKSKESLDPAYYQAALSLGKPGRVSGIVRTPFGLHLIKLTAVRSWDDADHGQIKRQLFEEKRSALFDRYLGKLRQQAKVSVNSSLLKE